eukprot:6212130-Pleurochrysis_carterae.AAC.3
MRRDPSSRPSLSLSSPAKASNIRVGCHETVFMAALHGMPKACGAAIAEHRSCLAQKSTTHVLLTFARFRPGCGEGPHVVRKIKSTSSEKFLEMDLET